jgi:hypothetical protein
LDLQGKLARGRQDQHLCLAAQQSLTKETRQDTQTVFAYQWTGEPKWRMLPFFLYPTGPCVSVRGADFNDSDKLCDDIASLHNGLDRALLNRRGLLES